MAALLLIWASQVAPLALAAPARSVSELWREVHGHSGTPLWSLVEPTALQKKSSGGDWYAGPQRAAQLKQKTACQSWPCCWRKPSMLTGSWRIERYRFLLW